MAVTPEVIFPGTQIFYTATNGSDSNPGSIKLPFLTIAKGVSVLTPGAILYIRSGTYNESILDTIPSGTSISSPVTVSAYPGETVTLLPSSTSFVLLIQSQQFITVENIIFDGTNATNDVAKITYVSVNSHAANITLSGCEMRNAPNGMGLLISSGTAPAAVNNNRIVNCLVHDNGLQSGTPTLRHGIYCESNFNTFTGNTIYNNSAYGMQIFSSSATHGTTQWCSNNTINGNIFYGNKNRSGLAVTNGDSNLIYNNLLYNNADGGIYLAFGPTNFGCYNNTVYNNHGIAFTAGIQLDGSLGATGTIENNISYQNTTKDYSTAVVSGAGIIANYNLSGDTSATGANSITGSNPIFLNQSIADFRLGSLSSALNAGVTVAQVQTDILSLIRPQGSAYSMGAYDASYIRTPLTFYTATNGSDSNSGSIGSPFLTIAHGLSQLAPDDTLFIRVGTYLESMTTIPGGVNASHQVTVSAYQSEVVTLQPTIQDTAAAVANFAATSRQWIVVKNLILDAVNLGASTYGVQISSGGQGVSQNITITGCEIKNAVKDGVHISGTGTGANTITGCTIHDNTNFGIACDTPNNSITLNTVYNCVTGISLATGTIAPDSCTVDSNICRNCTTNGIASDSGTGCQISNNLLYSNTQEGFKSSSSTNTLVYNNTIYNNNAGHAAAAGLSLKAGGTGFVVENNISYLNGLKDYNNAASGTTSDYNLTGDNTAVGAHSLPNTNPNFVNAGAGNFLLNSGSPAINAGVTLASVPKDFLGMTRPQGTSYCIGAYEFPT